MSEQNIQCHLGDDELPVEVYFDYTPKQTEILNPIEYAQPGYEPFVTINSIVVKYSLTKQAEIMDCLSEEIIYNFEGACLEYMNQ